MILKDTCTLPVAGGASASPVALNPWLKLLIGIALILFFMFGIGSLAQYIPGARHMAHVIDERNLRVTAIYYTDFEEPAEGSERIRDSLDYTPGGKP
jgi:hypothetical protein